MPAVELSPQAIVDIEGITDHIAEDDPERAMAFAEELRSQCERIARMPRAYPMRPHLASDGLRACAYRRYVIHFRPIGEQSIRITRILHSARRIGRADFGP